jgi:hypothetical protein
MNYQAFTNDSLTMMYEGIRGALASDDATKAQGGETRFRVRETPDWKKHAADLEAEMIKRGMFFEVIDWSEDQATLRPQRWRAVRWRGSRGTPDSPQIPDSPAAFLESGRGHRGFGPGPVVALELASTLRQGFGFSGRVPS